jgi:hypothetical protein
LHTEEVKVMSQYDEILEQVPLSQLAGQLGVDENEARQAAEQALPALLGGLQANAADPAGANSIMNALAQHGGGVPNDLEQVDVADGQKIVGNIFGDNTDQVMNQLGGMGGGATGDLVKRMLPVLAPIVLSWLAKKMSGQGGLGGMLGGVLGVGSRRPVRWTRGHSSPAVRARRVHRRSIRPGRARLPSRARRTRSRTSSVESSAAPVAGTCSAGSWAACSAAAAAEPGPQTRGKAGG